MVRKPKLGVQEHVRGTMLVLLHPLLFTIKLTPLSLEFPNSIIREVESGD